MTTKQKSNFYDIRSSNLSFVLRLIRENAPISRADIARHTGLTRSTASSLVDELIELGYVEQIGLSNKTTVGKKATMLGVRTNKIFTVGINFTGDDIFVAKINLNGVPIQSIKSTIGDTNAENIIKTTISMVRGIIEEIKSKQQLFFGIGVAFPGPVDNGVLRYPASFKNLDNVNFLEVLDNEFSCPIHVENNADCAALAESWFGRHINVNSLMYILIEQGVGCGIVINKELYYGKNRLSNEAGHIIVKPDGPKCFCGNNGCMAAIASDRGILNLASDEILEALSIEKNIQPTTKDIIKIIDYLEDHNKEFEEYIKEVSMYLGIGLASLYNTWVPDVILVEGSLLKATGFLEQTRESAASHIHPIYKDSLCILPSHLGRSAPLVGAATFLLKDLYFNPLSIVPLLEEKATDYNS